jgi:hypothetical protein
VARSPLTEEPLKFYLCPDNLEDGLVNFSSNSVVHDTNYVYVIATSTDVILNVMDSASFNFGPLPLMELRVYAISYTGDLLAGPGTSILFSQLATGCVSVSNFVTIFNDNPEAGEISFTDVPPTNVSCTVDGDGTIGVATTSTSVGGLRHFGYGRKQCHPAYRYGPEFG